MPIPGLPSPAIPYNSLIVVTGCTGFIGSHVADQILAAGYRVRGTTRDSRKNAWATEYFGSKYGEGRFELVEVRDLTAADAFKGVVGGASGFIHVAHDMTGSRDPKTAIPLSVDMAMSALKTAAAAGLKRFVYTSSSFAVTQPKPGVRFTVDEGTFNEEAVRKVEELGERAGGATVYAASKVEVERAMGKWVREEGVGIVVNCVNPNANLGPVLSPANQGYPTTAGWVKNLWEGNYSALKRVPEHYINVVDDAKLHVIALAHPDLENRRLLAMAAPAPISEIVRILKTAYPERKFEHFEDDGTDECVNADAGKVEELLRETYGHGYTGLEESVRANAKELV